MLHSALSIYSQPKHAYSRIKLHPVLLSSFLPSSSFFLSTFRLLLPEHKHYLVKPHKKRITHGEHATNTDPHRQPHQHKSSQTLSPLPYLRLCADKPRSIYTLLSHQNQHRRTHHTHFRNNDIPRGPPRGSGIPGTNRNDGVNVYTTESHEDDTMAAVRWTAYAASGCGSGA